ncbi:MAG TPA: hypothetical protein VML19_01920 [Verrucomicrobiae bacterium]|nr:hypothetical protein [Verrucomicrobiae bacterium]
MISWRAMAHGAAGLAFGLSGIPVLACVLLLGIYLLSWVEFGLGSAGIGPGGVHIYRALDHNPLIDSIRLAGQPLLGTTPAVAVEKALREIDANPELLNQSIPVRGTPLNVALANLDISLTGNINGDAERQGDLMRLVREHVGRGAHLDHEESTDIRKTWLLRRAFYDGPVTTSSENPLVWRIVTHDRSPSRPWNPLTEPLPPRQETPSQFMVRDFEIPLLNRPTRLHGTPLYAALLDHAPDVCGVLIRDGGHLSAEEHRDGAATAALQALFERDPALRAAYTK